MKVYKWPFHWDSWIDKQLKYKGYGLSQSKDLAKAILTVSDSFKDQNSVTPWESNEGWVAYLCYFFPLNYIRSLKVIDEAKAFQFFDGIQSAVDLGCGPGTSTKAMIDSETTIPHFCGLDNNPNLKGLYLDAPRKSTELDFRGMRWPENSSSSLLMASYVLNELEEIPEKIFNFDRLMLLEPSTHQAFPKIVELRKQLIEKGYQIVAPCPHHQDCPLETSKKDWCHDRVHWESPKWFQEIEKHLPMKNRTLTFSYLLASKTPLAKPDFSRVVGDHLKEKGKSRWLLCRSSEREFLSHLKKQGKPPEIHRGERIEIENPETKGNEVRFTKITHL